MKKLIFLSHIHEESNLAVLIKNAIELEFSGFVDVFVSSDGVTIPSGANFLKRIEDGLLECVAAIYLISPRSVNKSWINFELGAVWIRNCQELKNGHGEIPTLPFCHSGMTFELLPKPISDLSAIIANSSAQLEVAFKSIQKAVGGSGKLRTDFETLASEIITFENNYTKGDKLIELLNIARINKELLLEHCERKKDEIAAVDIGFVPGNIIESMDSIISGNLLEWVKIETNNPGTQIAINDSQQISSGAQNGAKVVLFFEKQFVTSFRDLLIK